MLHEFPMMVAAAPMSPTRGSHSRPDPVSETSVRNEASRRQNGAAV